VLIGSQRWFACIVVFFCLWFSDVIALPWDFQSILFIHSMFQLNVCLLYSHSGGVENDSRRVDVISKEINLLSMISSRGFEVCMQFGRVVLVRFVHVFLAPCIVEVEVN
jgi:hypothetical protein